MWNGKKVAVIFSTYREKNSIYNTIREFDSSGYVDEIIVVDNNAEPGTEEEVKKTGAKLLKEHRQGFGYGIRKGIRSTKADLIIISEPDGTYDGRDVIKLLAYSDDFEMVFGSRTHLPLIKKGSDMTLIKRYGDVLLGKLTTLLFNCSPLTDMGCAYRITTRKAWNKIKKECQSASNIFSTEWVCAAAKSKIKFMEIPINFRARVGKSALVGTLWKGIMWGVRKFVCIWKTWFYSLKSRTKKKSRDFFLISLLAGLTLYAWRLLPQLIIRASGLIYLSRSSQEGFWSKKYFYTGFETGAYLFGTIFSKLFKTNFPFYFYAELVVMVIIAGLFYLTVLAITRRRIVAFAAALIFGVNYFGNWNMYTNHCYCFFLERIPEVILLIPSLLFLHLYLEKSRLKYYLVSLIFYFLGIGLNHFALLFTAPYVFYPFFWKFFHRKNYRDILIGILIASSYLALSGFFVLIQQISESGLNPERSFLDFVLHPQKYQILEQIIRQLVYWSQYPALLLKGIGHPEPLRFVESVPGAEQITPLIIIVYLFAGWLIYKRLPKFRALLFTTIFGIVGIFFLNVYFGQYHVLIHAGSSRYLYFPTFLLAIFWALFLLAIFWQKTQKWLRFSLGIVILIGYYLVSSWLINLDFERVFEGEKPTKTVYNYLIKNVPKLPKNTLVVGPFKNNEIGPHESIFFTEQLGRDGEIRVMSEYNDAPEVITWQEAASASAHVVRLRYDKDCQCVKEEKIK